MAMTFWLPQTEAALAQVEWRWLWNVPSGLVVWLFAQCCFSVPAWPPCAQSPRHLKS